MSMFFGPFTVTVGALEPIITTQFPNASMAVFLNESPYTLKVDPGTGSYFVVSAFTQDAVPLGNQFSGVLKVTAAADANFTGASPIMVLYVQVYAKGEPVLGTYPAALTRIANVGNNVPLGTSAASIVNDGNPAGTQIIEATTNDGVQHVLMFNDGNLALQKDATSADQEMLDLVDLAVGGHIWAVFLATGATHGLYFTANGNIPLELLASGGIQTDNGVITTDGAGHIASTAAAGAGLNNLLRFAPSDDASIDVGWRAVGGEFLLRDNVSGLRIASFFPSQGGIKISGLGSRMAAWSFFSGTGSGTFSHGLGATPTVVLAMQNTVGSQTMGWDSANATTVHITAGNGAAWTALALSMA